MHLTPKYRRAEKNMKKLLDIYIQIVSFFECANCGTCCSRGPPDLLFSDEYPNFDKDILYWDEGIPGIKSPCPFFIDNKCKIHSSNIKPRVCRLVPFYSPEEGQEPMIDLVPCKLGEKILEEYYHFVEETNIDKYDNIFTMTYPFANPKRAKAFLTWLKKKRGMQTIKRM